MARSFVWFLNFNGVTNASLLPRSNASSLWLGMRPADIFVYVFLPPFLLDLAVRIDYFMLKKRAIDILFMAFVMVASITMLLIPFLLYALDLQSSGWSAR